MKYYEVFVYGTLRKGGGNHHILRGALCLKSSYWLSGYCLYDFQGWYPFMLRGNERDQVLGEVYRVDEPTLVLLNQLEDVEHNLYRLVYLEGHAFYSYLKYDNNTEGLLKITGGDWLAYSSTD